MSDVQVPRLAESISEAVLVAWLKQDGETVRVDEPIATLETDKAAVEIPADVAGVLRHARKEGDKVEVGDVIARIEEGAAATEPEKRPSAPAASPAPEPPRDGGASTAGVKPPPAAPGVKPPAMPWSPPPAREAVFGPAVRRMVEEHAVDPAAIAGSGRGGRLLKEDVQRHLEGGTARPASAPRPTSVPAPSAAPAPQASAGPATAPWTEGEVERAVPMTRIRQRIAERLVQAQQTAAILTTFNEVDMTAVMELRARFRESFEQRHGVRLSYMSFFTRACVLALQQIPEMNAQIRGTDIVYQRHVHMGIAVGTDRGLLVPVVKHADQRAFADLEKEIARLGQAAREHRIMLDQLSGGTFTISNGGVYGSLLSTPILNPPQSGILGMHKIEKRPVVVDEQLVIRPMMYLALSYDHRIIDGEQAVTFLVSVKQRLEDPERMLLDV